MVVTVVFECHTCGDRIPADAMTVAVFRPNGQGGVELVPDRQHGGMGHTARECMGCNNIRQHPANPTSAGQEATVFETYTRPDNYDTVIRTRVGDRHTVIFVYPQHGSSPQIIDYNDDKTSAIHMFNMARQMMTRESRKAVRASL